MNVLDSLPKQPASEGLEEEIARYLREECSADDEPSISDIARHFAEWGINQGKEVKDAALKLCETVERYTNGAALRSELLNTVTQTRQKMR